MLCRNLDKVWNIDFYAIMSGFGIQKAYGIFVYTLYLCVCVCVLAGNTPGNINSNIRVPSAFQKYSTLEV